MSENITATQGDDWVCICGNTPDDQGFYPYHDGRQIDPNIGSDWDGDRYGCRGCNRVINQHTLEVVEHPDFIAWEEFICPACDGLIPNDETPGAYPGALSRRDNRTEICSACGTREALEDFTEAMTKRRPGQVSVPVNGGRTMVTFLVEQA